MNDLDCLIEMLCNERGESTPALWENDKFNYFRALVNVRSPKPISREFLKLQDQYLQRRLSHKSVTDIASLTPMQKDLYLWKGDITTLKCDAIVNAANSQLLGCFCPCHSCIDNAIHTFAGVQLRLECADIMQKQGCEEAVGKAKITKAYNLPSKYILHTVGPIVYGNVTEQNQRDLAGCYYSCLALADKHELHSIAFCCISTGEFHFPNSLASQIALHTVRKYKEQTYSNIKVIFNVFSETDYEIYARLFGENN